MKQTWLGVDFHTIKIQDASTNYTCVIMDQGKQILNSFFFVISINKIVNIVALALT